jgi:hypothetical protein
VALELARISSESHFHHGNRLNLGCQMVFCHTKIPIWVYFGGPGLAKKNVGIYYDHVLALFGIFYGHLV